MAMFTLEIFDYLNFYYQIFILSMVEPKYTFWRDVRTEFRVAVCFRANFVLYHCVFCSQLRFTRDVIGQYSDPVFRD